VALPYVVRPTKALAEVAESRGPGSPELRQRALELVEAGYSQAKAGAAVGVPRTTIQLWLRKAVETRPPIGS
jgi:transposase-like protein